ncbi:hypothetical protein BHM03_00010488 [Ensete ventricosum]|nr:hypothetical protein BHM03_00010488 [Ensete ventricosum]
MKLQSDNGPRSSLGIGPGSDNAVGSRWEFAKRFAEGVGKLVGNMKGDHQKKTGGLAARMLEATGLAKVGPKLSLCDDQQLSVGKPPRWRLNRLYHIMHAVAGDNQRLTTDKPLAQLGARTAPPRYPETTSATHPPWTGSKLEIFQQTTSITKVKVRVVQLLLQLPARLFGITKLCLQVVDLSLEAGNSLLDNSHRLRPNAPLNFSDLCPKADHFVVHNTNDSTRVMDAFDQSHRIMLILPNGKREPTTIEEGRLPRKEQQRQEPYPDQLLGHSIDEDP